MIEPTMYQGEGYEEEIALRYPRTTYSVLHVMSIAITNQDAIDMESFAGTDRHRFSPSAIHQFPSQPCIIYLMQSIKPFINSQRDPQ